MVGVTSVGRTVLTGRSIRKLRTTDVAGPCSAQTQRDLPASDPCALGLRVCATTLGMFCFLIMKLYKKTLWNADFCLAFSIKRDKCSFGVHTVCGEFH